MDSMKYRYPSETLAKARRSLMLPHPSGAAESLANAFNECSLGCDHLTEDMLDDNARRWLSIIISTIDTTGVDVDPVRGAYYKKAERLSIDDVFEFSDAVDQLADWLHNRFFYDK